MEQTVKRKIGVRDIMTIAAMMVINFAIAMVIGMVTLPFPAVYLYGSAGIDAFIGATFYLVAANRINKHGLLFAWAAVYLFQGIQERTALNVLPEGQPLHHFLLQRLAHDKDCIRQGLLIAIRIKGLQIIPLGAPDRLD